jgi:flagellar basal-body rod modification protein FlgD
MTTTSTTAAQAVNTRYSTPSTSSNSKTPGADTFMQILLAQMQHQNPMEPMNDSEMISQFSQLNSLQALTGMKDMLSEMASVGQVQYGASLIGCTVRASRANNTQIEGVVSAVEFKGGNVLLTINNEKISLDNLISVTGKEAGK